MKYSATLSCKQAGIILSCLVTAFSLAYPLPSHGEPASSWTHPENIVFKKIGGPANNPLVSNTFSNTNCYSVTYRLKDKEDMASGCFSQSGIGLMQIGGGTVIFNGSDEALPLIPSVKGEVLIPWPGSGRIVSLVPVATGGMRLGVYLFPAAGLEDNRVLGDLVAKRINVAPYPLTASGKAMDVNPQALAFSANGEWLIAETVSGSFVRVSSSLSPNVLPFAQAFSLPGEDRLLDSYIAVDNDGRHAVIYNQSSETFRVYDLDDCGPAKGRQELPPLECTWYDYMPAIKHSLPQTTALRRVRFLNRGLIQLQVTASSKQSDLGLYSLSPNDYAGPFVNYLALGDSYTSGEGAFDYMEGTDTENNKCHLSLNSYPFLLLNTGWGAGSSVACSGAVIRDIGSTSKAYKGQARGRPTQDPLASFTPGYIPQHEFASQYQPAVITTSVGGNDIGFGDIIATCVLIHLGSNNCYSGYEDRLELKHLIDSTKPRLISLYSQIAEEAPGAILYVIGYPQVANKDGSCGINVRLSWKELQFAEEVINYLNDSIQNAAAEAGVNFIDVSHALDGHRLCESDDPAVNGLTAGNDAGPIGHESYHPNALGQRLIAGFILKQTVNFSRVAPVTKTSPLDGLLNAPLSHRALTYPQPIQDMSPLYFDPNDEISVSVMGLDYGLRPNSSYSIQLDGAELGKVDSDNNAAISSQVFIPQDATPGVHYLEIVGQDLSGKTTTVRQLVYSGIEAGISVKISGLAAHG